MTREEAIFTLRGLFIPCASDGNKWGCDRNEAIDMAIEALSSAEVQAKCIAEIKVDAEDIYTRITGLVADKVDVVRCKDCIRNNDGNFCYIAFFINDDGDGFCNCGERQCNYFGERV